MGAITKAASWIYRVDYVHRAGHGPHDHVADEIISDAESRLPAGIDRTGDSEATLRDTRAAMKASLQDALDAAQLSGVRIDVVVSRSRPKTEDEWYSVQMAYYRDARSMTDDGDRPDIREERRGGEWVRVVRD